MTWETTTVDKYASTAHELITLLGGTDNVRAVQHCVTRLRLKLVDHDAVDDRAIRDHPAILGRLATEDGLHLIVGPAAAASLARAVAERT